MTSDDEQNDMHAMHRVHGMHIYLATLTRWGNNKIEDKAILMHNKIKNKAICPYKKNENRRLYFSNECGEKLFQNENIGS